MYHTYKSLSFSSDQHSEDKVVLVCEPSTLTGLETQLLQEMHWLTIHPLPKPCIHADKVCYVHK